jgi:hypothetical protein
MIIGGGRIGFRLATLLEARRQHQDHRKTATAATCWPKG